MFRQRITFEFINERIAMMDSQFIIAKNCLQSYQLGNSSHGKLNDDQTYHGTKRRLYFRLGSLDGDDGS